MKAMFPLENVLMKKKTENLIGGGGWNKNVLGGKISNFFLGGTSIMKRSCDLVTFSCLRLIACTSLMSHGYVEPVFNTA